LDGVIPEVLQFPHPSKSVVPSSSAIVEGLEQEFTKMHTETKLHPRQEPFASSSSWTHENILGKNGVLLPQSENIWVSSSLEQ